MDIAAHASAINGIDVVLWIALFYLLPRLLRLAFAAPVRRQRKPAAARGLRTLVIKEAV